MKQNKLNLRNSRAAIAALLLCFAVSSAYAQTIYPQIPGSTDSYWYTSAGSGANAHPIRGLNAAMISYGSVMSPNYIYASAYYDASGAEKINVNDGGGWHNSIGSHSTMNSVPDIIIGNVTGAATGSICTACYPAIDYLLATAFISNGLVKIDIYDVNDNLGVFTLTYLTTVTPTGSYVPVTVHIDVIADAQNTGTTNFPFCDNFVVTWDDFTTPASPNVFAAYGNLNAGTLNTPVQINPTSGTPVYGHAPDVAAIRRSGFGPPPIHDMALITYVDAGNDKLYYSEWDITGSVTPTSAIYDNGSTVVTNISKPRIDAWDDYNYNSLSNTYSVYKIAAQVDSNITIGGGSPASYQVIRTYDNLVNATTSLPHTFTCSDVENTTNLSPTYTSFDPTVAPYNCYAPTVAVSGPIDYRVMHFTSIDNSNPNNNIVFLEPINFGFPDEVLANAYYYWVNSISDGTNTLPHYTNAYNTYANAVSGPANNVYGANVVYAWAWYNSTATDYEVSYKIPGPGVYDFKPGPLFAPVTNAAVNGWKVFPNPATNALTVTNSGTAGAPLAYHILDMEGRILLWGSLPDNGSLQIDVSKLAAGTYAIMVYKDGDVYGERLWVKE